MKKILIALPLALIMLLSMVPVMAADKDVEVGFYFSDDPFKSAVKEGSFIMKDVEEAVRQDEAKLEAAVLAAGKAKYGKEYPEEDYKYIATAIAEVEGVDEVSVDVAQTVRDVLGKDVTIHKFVDTSTGGEAPKGGFMLPEGFEETDYATKKLVDDNLKAAAADATATPIDGKHVTKTEDDAYKAKKVTTQGVEAVEASGTFSVIAKCEPEEEEEKPVCVEPCEFITVALEDVHSGANLGRWTKVFKVDSTKAQDFEAILDLYLDQYFPWHAWQPLKNYLNVYSIITPSSIEDCTIIIQVIPRFEYIMVVHELWDCCITPDGEVKEELARSFVEDTQRYDRLDPAYFNEFGETVMGTPDGVMPIPFLEFHTDLMVGHTDPKINQEKAAKFAQTRLEKMNAKDFVFKEATFYPNIRLSAYFTGEVYDMSGKILQKTWTNGIPTIVIKYLRAECIQTDEKVDDAKVVAGQAASTPVQQLPATGAKDVTAFFMSAVALLGLGIFFAKKR